MTFYLFYSTSFEIEQVVTAACSEKAAWILDYGPILRCAVIAIMEQCRDVDPDSSVPKYTRHTSVFFNKIRDRLLAYT